MEELLESLQESNMACFCGGVEIRRCYVATIYMKTYWKIIFFIICFSSIWLVFSNFKTLERKGEAEK